MINDTIADLPGDADFTGVDDSDGDGKDDDGKVQANVNEHAACLRIEADGNTNVDRGMEVLALIGVILAGRSPSLAAPASSLRSPPRAGSRRVTRL